MKTKLPAIAALILVLTLAILASPPASSPSLSASGLLDGRTFVGAVGPKGKAADSGDEIVFRKGTLRSTACDSYGFESGSYSAVAEGAKIRFHAVTRSPTDGRIEWTGTIDGDQLTGTFIWRKGLFRRSYWVDAKLKQ